ncbi:MAG: lysozyme [Gammaproteobacteria bacterium]|nr:lysozyme [Gammaproteobacteria bacterium]
MQISQKALDHIKGFEALRLEFYRDAVGVGTIGWGHTKTALPGQKISRERAEMLLRSDVAEFERCVSAALSVSVTQAQFDALVSWAFNVGCGAMRKSTLMRKLNAGDVAGAADEFLRWNKAGGKVLRGLTRRREAERLMFLEP